MTTAVGSGRITVLDPTAVPNPERKAIQPRPGDLRGLRVGILDNAKGGADVILKLVAETLREQHGVGEIVYRRKRGATMPAEASILEELARNSDVVINGTAD